VGGPFMKSIKAKLMLVTSVLIMIILVVTGSVTIFLTSNSLEQQAKQIIEAKANGTLNMLNQSNRDIEVLKNEMLVSYDDKIQNQVQNAISLVNYVYNEYKSGILSEDEAKKKAIDLIKSLRYGKTGYFWIDDVNGILIAHPMIPQKEGINRINLTDPKGKKIMREVISAAKDGKNDGYTDFMWEKPNDVGTGKLSPKRAYSQLFKPWNWIISTGNYVDNIYEEVDKYNAQIKNEFKNNIEKASVDKDIIILNSKGEVLYNTQKNLKLSEDIENKFISTKNEFLNYSSEDSKHVITDRVAYVKYDESTGTYVVISTSKEHIFGTVKKM